MGIPRLRKWLQRVYSKVRDLYSHHISHLVISKKKHNNNNNSNITGTMKTYPYMRLQFDLAPQSLCSKTQSCICVLKGGYPRKAKSCRTSPEFSRVACAQCAETRVGTCTIETNFDLSKKIEGGDLVCLDDSVFGVSSVSPTSIVLVPPCPQKESLHARVSVKMMGLARLRDNRDREIGLTARDEWDNLHFDRETNRPVVRGPKRLVGVRTFPSKNVAGSSIPRKSENSPLPRPLDPKEALDHVPRSPPPPSLENSPPIAMVQLEADTLTRVETQMIARVHHGAAIGTLPLFLFLSPSIFKRDTRFFYTGSELAAQMTDQLRQEQFTRFLSQMKDPGIYPPGFFPKGKAPSQNPAPSQQGSSAGLIKEILHILGPKIPMYTVPSVIPGVRDVVTMMLSERLGEKLRDYLVPALDKRMTGKLVDSLLNPLTSRISELVNRVTPVRLTRRLMRGLMHVLPRSVVQSLVPSLVHTMSHSPLQDYYCYYCYHHNVYCSYCHYAPSQLYYAQYYATYYSQYYANYFEDAYSEWLSGTPKRRKGDHSFEFGVVDKILKSERSDWDGAV